MSTMRTNVIDYIAPITNITNANVKATPINDNDHSRHITAVELV